MGDRSPAPAGYWPSRGVVTQLQCGEIRRISRGDDRTEILIRRNHALLAGATVREDGREATGRQRGT